MKRLILCLLTLAAFGAVELVDAAPKAEKNKSSKSEKGKKGKKDKSAKGEKKSSKAYVAGPSTEIPIDEAVDLKPFANKVYGLRTIEKKDAKTLVVVLGASQVMPNPLKDRESWRILSDDDANYDYEKFVRPDQVTIVESNVEFPYPEGMREPNKTMIPLKRTVIELTAPKPLKEGAKYSVVAMGVGIEPVTCARTGITMGADKVSPETYAARIIGLRRVSSVGDGKILCEFGAGFSPQGGLVAKNWTVTVNGMRRSILQMGRRSVIDFYQPNQWGGNYGCLMVHQLYVDLGEAFENGAKIKVEVNDKVTAGGRKADMVFNDSESITKSIQVNQVGYLTDGPKYAYVGCWFGSMPDDHFIDETKDGGDALSAGLGVSHTPFYQKELSAHSLRFDANPDYEVVNAKTGKKVTGGKAELKFTGDRKETQKTGYTAMNVWEIDFSKVKQPGDYYIRIPGVGRSFTFKIDDNIYFQPFKIQAQGIYCQRCGCPIDPNLSGGWRRISCHDKGLKATTILWGRGEQEKHLEKDPIDPSKVVMVNASGGHHDAGDYNPRSHLDVANSIMNMYELSPASFKDGQLNVPEHGNGIPDVLDEALWQLKLWVGLQEPDGGIHGGTESNGDPNFFQTVELDPLGDYAWAKSVYWTYRCASAFAQMSRILKSIGKVDMAKDYLARAERAYAWAVKNEVEKEEDPHCEAAAALYVTTGNQKYHDDFKSIAPWANGQTAELIVWRKYDKTNAAFQYLFASQTQRDSTIYNAIMKSVENEFEFFWKGSDPVPYKILRNSYSPVVWGTGAYENYCLSAGFCYKLTGNELAKKWLIRTCDNTLGANPLNTCWITGLGQYTIHCPLHNCRYRPGGEVVAGMQEQGPNQKGEVYSYGDTTYPKHMVEHAALLQHIDSHFGIVMNEPTVNNMVNTLFVFGLLIK